MPFGCWTIAISMYVGYSIRTFQLHKFMSRVRPDRRTTYPHSNPHNAHTHIVDAYGKKPDRKQCNNSLRVLRRAITIWKPQIQLHGGCSSIIGFRYPLVCHTRARTYKYTHAHTAHATSSPNEPTARLHNQPYTWR